MASLIVAVEPGRAVRAGDFEQLAYLDPRGTLFVVSGTRVIGYHDGPLDDTSELEPVDHDISAIIPRLGGIPTTPRVLPPGDVVLLRYTLGLPVDGVEPVEVGPIVRDARAEQLLAAVWNELGSDGPRMVYADYLESRGDPRGELINLQLARARDGGEVSARECELRDLHALDCVGELRPYLVPKYVELARGFLVRCMTVAEPIPPAIIEHPMWSTVEELCTTHVALARSSRLVSATTLRIEGPELPELVRSAHALPFDTIIGWSGFWVPQPGVRVPHRDWRVVCERGALANLRALSIDFDRVEGISLEQFLRSPLGRGLEQLDCVTRLAPHQAAAVRDAFEHTELPILTLQVPLAHRGAVRACIVLSRSEHGTRLAVQLDDALAAPEVTVLVRVIATVSRGLKRIVVEDTGDPANVVKRQVDLIMQLGAMFRDVVARDVPAERLAL